MRRLLHSIAPVFGGFIISLSAINAAKADAYQSNTRLQSADPPADV